MKNLKKLSPWLVLQLLIVAAMFLTGFLLYDSLPEQIPSHWNATGEVDSYMDKLLAVILFPSITFGVVILFPILSRIDPRKKKYEQFRRAWLILQTTIVSFLAYMFAVSMYLSFHPEYSAGPFVIGGIGVMFVLMGNYLGKIRQNYFVGIKTPWTLDNEVIWNKTHRLGGWLFVLAGLVLFGNAFIMWQEVAVTFSAVGIAVIVPILYSYLLHRSI